MNPRSRPMREPAFVTGEPAALAAYLDCERALVAAKVLNTASDDARRPVGPAGASVLGIIKHLTAVEIGWSEIAVQGLDVADRYWAEHDPREDFKIDDDDTPETILAAYDDACARSRAVLERHTSLETSVANDHGELVDYRWGLLHMIDETSRHLGHLDMMVTVLNAASS